MIEYVYIAYSQFCSPLLGELSDRTFSPPGLRCARTSASSRRSWCVAWSSKMAWKRVFHCRPMLYWTAPSRCPQTPRLNRSQTWMRISLSFPPDNGSVGSNTSPLKLWIERSFNGAFIQPNCNSHSLSQVFLCTASSATHTNNKAMFNIHI